LFHYELKVIVFLSWGAPTSSSSSSSSSPSSPFARDLGEQGASRLIGTLLALLRTPTLTPTLEESLATLRALADAHEPLLRATLAGGEANTRALIERCLARFPLGSDTRSNATALLESPLLLSPSSPRAS
jgi:hypothetical protein